LFKTLKCHFGLIQFEITECIFKGSLEKIIFVYCVKHLKSFNLATAFCTQIYTCTK